MEKRVEKIVAMAKEKSEKRKADVLQAIKELAESGNKVTFYKVSQLTGASKSFLYNNQEIADAIMRARDKEGSGGDSYL